MAGTTNLYLIRHGEADANVNQVVGGKRGDTGLTARGAREAELLRDRLAASREIAPDVFVASTFARARQTAEIVAPAFSALLSFDDDLQEIRPGEADGMSLQEAISKYGIPDFEREPERPVSPGGESWADLMNRAARTLERLSLRTRARPSSWSRTAASLTALLCISCACAETPFLRCSLRRGIRRSRTGRSTCGGIRRWGSGW
jgi:probable phosphoglycerate mutase